MEMVQLFEVALALGVCCGIVAAVRYKDKKELAAVEARWQAILDGRGTFMADKA